MRIIISCSKISECDPELRQICGVKAALTASVWDLSFVFCFVCLRVHKLKWVCVYLVQSVFLLSSACISCCSLWLLWLTVRTFPSFITGVLRPGHRKPARPESYGHKAREKGEKQSGKRKTQERRSCKWRTFVLERFAYSHFHSLKLAIWEWPLTEILTQALLFYWNVHN